VLYFIGGFVPSQPSIGTALWSELRKAPITEGILRRNLAAAALFAGPSVEDRHLDSVSVDDVDFGQLELRRTSLRASGFERSTITSLTLDECRAHALRLAECSISAIAVRGGRIDDAVIDRTTVERFDAERASLRIGAYASTLPKMRLQECDLRLRCEAGNSGEVVSERGRLVLHASPGQRIDRIHVFDGIAEIRAEVVKEIELDNSAARTDWSAAVSRWLLRDSVLFLSARRGGTDTAMASGVSLKMRTDATSLVVCDESLSVEAGTAEGTVHARVAPDALDRLDLWSGWAVLQTDFEAFPDRSPRARGALRHGAIIIVDHSWYEREVSPEGKLAAVWQLRQGMAAALRAEFAPARHNRPLRSWDLPGLLRAARSEHQALLNELPRR
jgi:hypothetical protein